MSAGNYYITGEYTGLDSSSPEVWMPMRLLQGFLKITRGIDKDFSDCGSIRRSSCGDYMVQATRVCRWMRNTRYRLHSRLGIL